MARSHENQTQRRETCHEGKPLSTAPYVHDLGQWDIDGSRDGIGDNVDDIKQRMRLEI